MMIQDRKTLNKISPQELRTKLSDIEMDGENVEEQIKDLKKYIQINQKLSSPAEAIYEANPETVDIERMNRGGLLGDLNSFSRRWRERRYRKKLELRNDAVKIVSEGDSWFQFPIILQDLVDQVAEPRKPVNLSTPYAVLSLGAAGDTLKAMVEADEVPRAIREENPQIFMFSAGGNDLFQDHGLGLLLHNYQEVPEADRTNPKKFINEGEFRNFLNTILDLYQGLFKRLINEFPNLQILCYGYDYVIPGNPHAIRSGDGEALGKPMNARGITDRQLQRDIMCEIMDRINEAQISLTNQPAFQNKVHHVDCRGVITNDAWWFDEIHPDDRGFNAVGERFINAIEQII